MPNNRPFTPSTPLIARLAQKKCIARVYSLFSVSHGRASGGI